jgi:hypothetical protein
VHGAPTNRPLAKAHQSPRVKTNAWRSAKRRILTPTTCQFPIRRKQTPITFTSPSAKAHQKSGPFPPPALLGFDGPTTLSDSYRDVEAATLTQEGPLPITRTTFPTCRGYACRLLAHSCNLPQMAGGAASALSLSRPAQASLALRPTGSLSRPKVTFVTRLQPFRSPG